MGHQVVNQESTHKECERILPMPCRDGMKLDIFEMLDHLFLLQT
jgi:hypothetical protein